MQCQSSMNAVSNLHSPSLVVLVVDDDPFWLITLRCQLAELGVTNILFAQDGATALDLLHLRQGDVDLVICDISMPQADGFHVLEDIAQTGFEGKLLFVSGMDVAARDMLKSVSAAQAVDVLDVLEKPVSLRALGSVVANAFSH